ncbi:MAG: flagellar protein FhlB [Rhodospirillaceae bacterium]|mgnify:CR=1 FL=1|nr:flagellar protein FhlB [Rhodospirillaceae bacterium]MBT5245493.1 flagellar protein FhlB [Rhodospirillaceae bacterium]MBT5560975.1 flagellar protein FhlB [Rhodospirillaceae bacterium]MBT6240611.1 flagellar protein FhlB [Rhodospirillaceae bacterium]MBT7137924.1 flagellar protein FhlB [Rhodospirillaceae bacterium]
MNILANDENGSGDGANKGEKRTDAVAVALEYDPDSEFAPKVVAGGRGAIAEQILQIAFAQGVKVREDADLAEMLSAIDVDSEIPLEAFAAVAEILSYVYRANGNMPDFINEEEPSDDPDTPGETP